MLASFKSKLAVYFLLLAVAPLSAAFWGFGTFAKRAEERRVDARLGAELRAVVASYDRRLNGLSASARALAQRADVQQAFRKGRGPHRLAIGRRAELEAKRVVEVRAGRRVVGSIVATLPFDKRLLRELRADAGLASGDRIVFARRGSRLGRRPQAVSLAHERYRALASEPLAEQANVQIAVLAPAAPIAAEAAATRRHLLYALLGALLVLAVIAAAEARSIVRWVRELAGAAEAIGRGQLDRRIPVRGRDEFAHLAASFNSMADQLRTRLLELDLQRARLRESLNRTGELLTATHDETQLLSLIASAAVEAADAEGAVLIGEHGAVVEVGTLADDAETVELPVATGESGFGILVLYGDRLQDDDLAAARALVAQGANALENARLHETVALQAVSDGLTGLANRRHTEERLAAEIARSERYGTPLSVVACDIDGFKAANDTYGHAFGDVVLQEFASVLRETLRDVDVSGRWGGEEFLLVLPETTLEGAIDAAERIRSALVALDVGPARMTASFGVAELTRGSDAAALVASADAALYQAKRGGKNRVEAAAHARVAEA
jgi:diguanylate cyclase (GGDEF)-like protein